MTFFFTLLFLLSSYGGPVHVRIGPFTNEEDCRKLRRDIIRYMDQASLRPTAIGECEPTSG